MSETTSKLTDEFAKIMMDAAGVAQGVRREAEEMLRAQGDKVLSSLDLVKREELSAAMEISVNARTAIDALQIQIQALEARITALENKTT
jgi:BMFP domain-containing protein YqiC